MDSNPLIRRIIQNKLKKSTDKPIRDPEKLYSSKALQDFNTEPIIDQNNKFLKTLQFQLNMLVSSGVQHDFIPRYNGQSTKLDIVEGTFKLFKIETRKLLSPLKLVITYKTSAAKRAKNRDLLLTSQQPDNAKAAKPEKDLRIYYSCTNPKPEENNCEGQTENPACLTITAPGDERCFSREYLFLKMATTVGCQAHLKLFFPKQDILDAKVKKSQQQSGAADAQGGGQNANRGGPSGSKVTKSKVSKDVDYMISKLIAEPRQYDNFMEELKQIKEQQKMRKGID